MDNFLPKTSSQCNCTDTLLVSTRRNTMHLKPETENRSIISCAQTTKINTTTKTCGVRMARKTRTDRPTLIPIILCLAMITLVTATRTNNWATPKKSKNTDSIGYDAIKPILARQASFSLWCIRGNRPKTKNSNRTIIKNNTNCHLLLLLLLSGDIELNPGPNSIYPCAYCELKVDYGMKAIKCDHCSMWYHKTCITMCTKDYENLENNSLSFLCYRCDHPNYVSNSFSLQLSTQNVYDPLVNVSNDITSEHDIEIFNPRIYSSPKGTRKERLNTTINNNSTDNAESNDNDLSQNDELPPKERQWRSAIVNANSIKGKLGELEYLIHTTDFDQIIMTETKLDKDIHKVDNKLKELGYKPYRDDRTLNSGGVMIAIKECYDHRELSLEDLNTDDKNTEDTPGVLKWIEVSLKNRVKMYVAVFYRQPDGNLAQLKMLERSLNSIRQKMKNNSNSIIMIGGDFNCGFIDWENNTILPRPDHRAPHEKLLEIAADNDLTQHQIEPTRMGRTLDLFFTNKPRIVQSMHTLPGISDHDIPVADCDIKPSYSKKQPRKIYKYKKANWDQMRKDALDFHDEYLKECDERSVNANWKDFTKFVFKMMDLNIPCTTTNIRKNLPWLNTSLKRMIRKKQRLYNKAKRTHKKKDWNKYNSHKKETLKALRRARWNYINNMLIEGMNNDNNKPFWRFVKSQQKENTGVAPLQTKHGGLTNDSQAKAEILNEQFKSVFTKHKDDDMPEMEGPEYEEIDNLVINVKGVEKLLKNLKINKAPGPDDIPARILKELAEELAPILTLIFKQSLETGTLPDDWLKANVAPIYKKGNKNLAVNYRPVSLTCICCKVMEHILCRHILNHLDLHKILTTLQHGFRHGFSCETQLLLTLNDLMKQNNAKQQIDIIILDFSKAFDTVPHDKLLYKLRYYGIKGNIHNWISAFLKQRDQRVVVDGKSSKWIHVDSGVPQGTVLGPLLFLLFINDIPKCVSKETTMRLFADDCIVYRTIKTMQDQINLQKDLDALKKWADTWGMRFNASKCQVMRISRSRTPYERYYKLCNEILDQVDKTKYLGVTISDELSWSPHIENITSKANKVLGILRRNLKHCPTNLKETAYLTMVRSILEYACAVWDPHLQKDINLIERVQRKAARFVKGDYRVYLKEEQEYVSVSKMIADLKWKDLADRRRDTRLTLLYKIVHNHVNIEPDETLVPRHNQYPDRDRQMPARYDRTATGCANKQNFEQIRYDINSYRYSFYPRTVLDWNLLPESTVSTNSVLAFKGKLKAGTQVPTAHSD